MSSPSPSPSSSPPGSKASSKRGPLVCAAALLVKGSLVKVLGEQCKTTRSVSFAHAMKGEISVSYEGETLTQEQHQAIESQANAFIQADLPVERRILTRSQVEQHVPINHQRPLDDVVAAAAHASGADPLAVLSIPDVGVCCSADPFVERTGELKLIKLQKMKNSKKQKAYEFTFVVGSAAEEYAAKNAAAIAATNSKKTSAQQAEAVSKSKSSNANSSKSKSSKNAAQSTVAAASTSSSNDYVVETTQSILHEVIAPSVAKLLQQQRHDADSNATAASTLPPTLSPTQLSSLSSSILPSLESYLIMFANEAYTRGFTAAKKGNGGVDLARLL